MTSAPRAVRPSVNSWNAEYLEAQYRLWKQDPSLVAEDLAQFFLGFDLASSGVGGVAGALATNGAAPVGSGMGMGGAGVAGSARASEDRAQSAVSSLIQHYRERGHLCAAIDPFGRERAMPPSLEPSWHGLSESDLDRTFDAGSLSVDGSPMTLRDIIAKLDDTYCGSVGAEFAYVSDQEEWKWLAERMERTRNKPAYAKSKRFHILLQLYRAELFEKFCAKRYPGVKRFSLEGGEVIIPMLDRFVEQAGDDFDVQEIVFAMSHRGRLNVLTNIIGKQYAQIFTEFQDAWEADAVMGGGDVKYHRGYSANRVLPSGKHVWLAMNSNPSHLEAACAVALGRCRAKQRLRGDLDRKKVLPLLLHGDGAVIGQGVVAEDFNLSQLRGYTVGGTVHIVINNLIGFTTGQEDARSSRYCTDMAKIIEAPVLHVNGEDPDACVHAVETALEYRMMFKKDIVLDVLCYRRHGHNETDEAMFTQPLLYKEIKDKPSVVKVYAERLVAEGVIAEADAEQIRVGLDEQLDKAYEVVQKAPVDPNPTPGHLRWDGMGNAWTFEAVDTSVSRDHLKEIAGAMDRWPEGFTPHRKLVKTLQERAAVLEESQTFDWATGELLAVGACLLDGTIVRFSGQDSCRGTFSQRHAVLVDVETADRYVPLNHIRELGQPGTDKDVGTIDEQGRTRQAKFCIYDSPLSEFSVMGFEYGFSLASPRMLVIWEAQFGDFANGAQVIIDQFLAAGEAKWKRWSGLVLLLPHGYEGQGPEHSSARLERFLKLCGDQNLIVAYPSTPAQHFHMLRRQVKASYRKPLIVMTPKSLLRLPACRSSAEEITTGTTFHEILDDPAMGSASDRKKVKRVILCSGKVCYDLFKRRGDAERDDVAIVRVEQLYPLHYEMLKDTLSGYPKDAELMWVQEEPQNMGAWGHMHISLRNEWGIDLPCIGRPSRGTPATGSSRKHAQEQEHLLDEAIGALPAAKREPAAVH